MTSVSWSCQYKTGGGGWSCQGLDLSLLFILCLLPPGSPLSKALGRKPSAIWCSSGVLEGLKPLEQQVGVCVLLLSAPMGCARVSPALVAKGRGFECRLQLFHPQLQAAVEMEQSSLSPAQSQNFLLHVPRAAPADAAV